MIPTHWTQNDLTINGVSLHYWRTGDGSKPAPRPGTRLFR